MILNWDDLKNKYDLNIRGVIHIGAHHGQEYNLYKSHNISNIIFIEPLKSNFDILKKKVGEECTLYNLALGNIEGKIEMYVETANFGMSSSILKPKLHLTQYPFITFDNKEIVDIKRLDDIQYNRDNFNMINIDVQGYELEVFKGAKSSLNNIDYIISEINIDEVYEGCGKLQDLINTLEPYGFKLVTMDLSGITWGDALFVKYE